MEIKNGTDIKDCFFYFCLVYDNFVIMGGFNVAMRDNAMEAFCTLNNFGSLIKKPTC